MDQEQIMKFQVIQEEAQQLNQQMQLIEQNIQEIAEIESSLDELEKKETKEILANLGKKIFVPVEIKDRNLIVEVGNRKFVKKSIGETKELILEQINKLNIAKNQINERLESLQCEAESLVMEIEKSQEERETKLKRHNHKCDDPDCKHEH
jgi:prefoldin alpha subunit